MQQNVELTKGLIFSGQLLLDLSAAGMLREQAYKLIQGHAMESWEHDTDFRAAIESDEQVRKYLNPKQIEESFSAGRYLIHVDSIFQRVFRTTP
jgi:adenylosuccinate lyase